jgi:hypothetical protein
MAALNPSTPVGQRVSFVVIHEGQQFIVCTLESGRVDHQAIHLEYGQGQHVAFTSAGDHEIFLTGYLSPLMDEEEADEDLDYDDDEDDDDFDDEDGEDLDDDEDEEDDDDEDYDEDDDDDDDG